MDSMQSVSAEAVLWVPGSALRVSWRTRSNVVEPVTVSVDGIQVQVSVNMYRNENKKSYVTLDLRGIPDDADILVEGEVLKFLQAQQEEQHAEFYSDSSDSSSSSDTPSGEAGADATGKVRKYSVGLAGNGRLAEMGLAGTRGVRATLTLTRVRPLGACLHEARRTGTLCDVGLRAAGREFPAHKVVLSAASPTFLRMFTGNFVEAGDKDSLTCVDIGEVASVLAFDKLLEFLYTRHVADFQNEEIEVLGLADRYLVDRLRRICINRLMEVKKPKVVAVLRAAVECPFVPKEVRLVATKMLLKHWKELSDTPAWAEFQAAHPVGAMLLSTMAEVYSIGSAE